MDGKLIIKGRRHWLWHKLKLTHLIPVISSQCPSRPLAVNSYQRDSTFRVSHLLFLLTTFPVVLPRSDPSPHSTVWANETHSASHAISPMSL